VTINYTDDFGQPQTITQTLAIEVLPAFVFEEPIDEPIDSGPPPEPEPETPLQALWRFILGLIGLSSGQPQPDTGGDFGGEGFPTDGSGGGEPIPFDSQFGPG
jgi:hypothetical protein